MKKIIALLLCLIVCVTLFAGCKPEGKTGAKGVFMAGYSRADVTPDASISVQLAGHGYERPSYAVWDPLYATCTALKDEDGNTFLFYHCDFLKAYNTLNMSKNQITKATGIPAENIIIATTHNHSAPELEGDYAYTADYGKLIKKAMVKAAEEAIADLKPAKMFTSEIDIENMNTLRTIGVSSDFASELDKTMELIKFTREGGKDIVWMNWQGHPRGHGEDKLVILSDVHQIRKVIEPALDCHFAYFLGSSGNVNQASKITATYVDHGKYLADKAVEAAANFTQIPAGSVKKATTRVELTYKSGGGSENVAISVVSVGKSLAFAIVPYEMFSSSAKELKAYSRFDQTIISTCTDNHIGYIPTTATADTAYEARATGFVKGSAEQLVDGYKELLDQLYS